MSVQANVVINFDEIIQAIGEQFQSIWYALKQSADENISKEISYIKKIEISDEQSFEKNRFEQPENERLGTIYIVVKFGIGAINYGSSVTPITLQCLGTANKVRAAQLLFGVFSSTWTTKNLCQDLYDENNNSLENNKILQVWNTPEVISNFNETNLEFRNLFKLSGNIVIGPKAVRLGTLTYFYEENNNYPSLPAVGWESVNIMSFQDNFHTSFDTQPFGNTHGFTKSEADFTTYAFGISTFLLDNHLSADLLAIRGFRNRAGGSISSTFSPNDYMKLKLQFTNGFNNVPDLTSNPNANDEIWDDPFFAYFKVVDSQIGQEIAGIPTISISFTR